MTTLPQVDTTIKPWYRQFWPWFLLGIPATAMLVGFTMLGVAIEVGKRDTLVSDNYYKEGRAINMKLDRDIAAAKLGLVATLRASAETGLEVDLQSHDGAMDLAYLNIEVIHPTLGAQDQMVKAARYAPGRYQGLPSPALNGRWYLDIRDPDNTWRLKGEIALPSSSVLTLEPAVSQERAARQ